MELFYVPGVCSLAPHIALCESGLKFEAVEVPRDTKMTSKGNFLTINPLGYVPALRLDNGTVLTECNVILQYIAEQKLESKLIPKWGTEERWSCVQMLGFIATELHKGFGPLFDQKASPESKENALNRISKRFDFLVDRLKGKQFLMGDNFTVADAYLFTVLNWTPRMKIDMSKWPALMGYMEKVKMRPSVQKAMRDEGLLK